MMLGLTLDWRYPCCFDHCPTFEPRILEGGLKIRNLYSRSDAGQFLALTRYSIGRWLGSDVVVTFR